MTSRRPRTRTKALTRLGFLTDVHGDLDALDDALAQLDRIGCDRVVCGGDVLDYGPHPEATLVRLRERGIPIVRGNHERWATESANAGAELDEDDEEDGRGWGRSRDREKHLASLPRGWRETVAGVRVAVRHGSPRSDMDGIDEGLSLVRAESFLEAVEADVLLVGHTHRALVLELPDGRILANPGALLRRPRAEFRQEGIPCPGQFGVLELPTKRFTVHRASDGAEVSIPRVALTNRRQP
jgi:predicted phosphodiesterase